jgi:RecA-dependent nuclease
VSNKSKRHMARVAEIPCLICEHMNLGNTKAEVHHIGDSAERSDYLTIPLCPEHHRGALGFHGLGEREFNRKYGTSEIQLLARTLERL